MSPKAFDAFIQQRPICVMALSAVLVGDSAQQAAPVIDERYWAYISPRCSHCESPSFRGAKGDTIHSQSLVRTNLAS